VLCRRSWSTIGSHEIIYKNMSKQTEDTLAVRISRTLADRIIAGEIEPGARLRQDHIAEEFGASHVPVREAFRRLESQGLAVSEPRRGVRVAAFDLSEVKEVAEMPFWTKPRERRKRATAPVTYVRLKRRTDGSIV
jgi:DNA-binding FadR family transcriptional regulator